MKKLLIGLEAAKVKNKIHDDFFENFGIDLDSSEYATGNFCDKWKCLIEKCTIGKTRESLSEYINLFKEQLFDMIDIDRVNDKVDSIQIIGTIEDEERIRKQKMQEFASTLEEYTALLDNYHVYEVDIWLNAYLTIQYVKGYKKRVKEAGNEKIKTLKSQETKKECVDTTTYDYVEDRTGKKYRLPFKKEADIYFCGGYFKHILSNSGTIFWTEQDKEETVCVEEENRKEIKNLKDYKNRVSIRMRKDTDYSRFGYQKIKALENHKSFVLEDKILFHKTINGTWVRNMVNTMIESQEEFEAEDYIYLIDQLCGCKSLVWQNLISCLYIIVRVYQRELRAFNIYDKIFLMFDVWLSNIDRINFTLHRLTEGFIYLYLRSGCPNEELRKGCINHLRQLELENSRNVESYWEKASQKLRVTEDINRNHKYFEWIYAIFQREIINKTKYLYTNNQFSEKPLREDIRINYEGNEIQLENCLIKYHNFQPDLERAARELKEKVQFKKKEQI